MRRVLLIAVITGCSSAPRPAPPIAPPQAQAAETLWDRGTFVTVAKDLVLPDIEERFEIYRTSDGYRIEIRWKRPTLSGERSDGEVTLLTDARFMPLHGKMVSNSYFTDRTEVLHSTIQREPNGRLSTEVVASDGTKESGGSQEPNDWYIGGTITTFLVALCQADATVTAPTVYPDKATTLEPAKPLPALGADRKVISRALEYQQSHRKVIAVCEDGKLVGEAMHGNAIVRTGDFALAQVLSQQL